MSVQKRDLKMKNNINQALLEQCHKELIAKFIEELHYEEILKLEKNNDEFSLTLTKSKYYFKGEIGFWNHIWVNPVSLKTQDSSNSFISAIEFIKELNEFLKMDHQTLAQFIEEANQTIYCDYQLKLRDNEPYDLLSLNFTQLEQLSYGHPKLLLNKGRLGWSTEDLKNYAPEYSPFFKLIWVAIKKDHVSFSMDPNFCYEKLLNENEINFNDERYIIMPVHPWQWNKYIKVQFFEELAKKEMIYLGYKGEDHTPQVSIRTLSSRLSYDIKTSLSILNTSCVRGIPAKYITSSSQLSYKMHQIISSDEYLTNTLILKEVFAAHFKDSHFSELGKASYRYHELLGCVIRESVESKLNSFEKAISTASLLIKSKGKHLFELLIEDSKLSSSEWIKQYFKTVVLPLYHLQLKHGLGLVSHGQNIILILKESIPYKLIIKDFHGDLRISKDSIHLDASEFSTLERLESKHLIHDLYTGHFVSFLRFLSRKMHETNTLKEKEFYLALNEQIKAYEKTYGKNESISLLKEEFEKVLINKVRFVVGYNEIATRPLPILGENIKNPIYYSENIYESL